MRTKLKSINRQRMSFRGVFERYGSKPGFKAHPPIDTLLLRNVTRDDTGEIVTDHLWLTKGSQFAALGELHKGDVVSFDARVTRYDKGYIGRLAEERGEAWTAVDYRLAFPTKVKLLEASASSSLN